MNLLHHISSLPHLPLLLQHQSESHREGGALTFDEDLAGGYVAEALDEGLLRCGRGRGGDAGHAGFDY